MKEYEGQDLSMVEIPLSKQEELSDMYGSDGFNAQEYFNELLEVTDNLSIEDSEALEFDDLLYKVVKTYEKKVEVKPTEEIVETQVVPSDDELMRLVRDEIETLNDIISDNDLFEGMSDEQKILIKDQLETLTDIING